MPTHNQTIAPAPAEVATSSATPVSNPLPYQGTDDEDYMGEGQQAYFRQRLLSWKEELLAESQRTVTHWQADNRQEAVDSGDVAAHEEALAMAIRNRNREFRLIQKIEAALRRIDSQDYGYCESYGNEIGLGRLSARLTAELCIDCKQIAEIKEKALR